MRWVAWTAAVVLAAVITGVGVWWVVRPAPTPPMNVLRLSMHPGGLAKNIVNLGQWKAHVLWRLGQQIHATHDSKLIALEKELAGYPAPPAPRRERNEADAIAIPFELRIGDRVLSFISTITIFGTPADVTLSELAVEAFFPANPETAEVMRAMAGG